MIDGGIALTYSGYYAEGINSSINYCNEDLVGYTIYNLLELLSILLFIAAWALSVWNKESRKIDLINTERFRLKRQHHAGGRKTYVYFAGAIIATLWLFSEIMQMSGVSWNLTLKESIGSWNLLFYAFHLIFILDIEKSHSNDKTRTLSDVSSERTDSEVNDLRLRMQSALSQESDDYTDPKVLNENQGRIDSLHE